MQGTTAQRNFGTSSSHSSLAPAFQQSAASQTKSISNVHSANMIWDEAFEYSSFSARSPLALVGDQAISFVPPFSLDSEHIHILEREFCSNFKCCGRRLEDLHQLVQHFEDDHAIPSAPFRESIVTTFDDDNSSSISSASSSTNSPITPVSPLDLHGPRFFSSGDPRDASAYELPEFPHITMTPPLRPSDLPPFSLDKTSTEATMDVPVTPVTDPEAEQDAVMDYEPNDSDTSFSVDFAHSGPVPADLPTRPSSPVTLPCEATETRPTIRTVRPKSSISGKSAPSSYKKNPTGKSKSKYTSEALSPGRPESVSHRRHREKAHKCPKPGCVKSYLNPNGLKYHMTKGTCVFAEEMSSDTDNNHSEP